MYSENLENTQIFSRIQISKGLPLQGKPDQINVTSVPINGLHRLFFPFGVKEIAFLSLSVQESSMLLEY